MLKQGSRGEELTRIGLTTASLILRCLSTGLGKILNWEAMGNDRGCELVYGHTIT
jgi:hypothetical protein